MKKILSDAAAVGNATARTITYKIRQEGIYLYENSAWRNVFMGGYKCESPAVNTDGSVDVYFGPAAPAGRQDNWIQTIPGKGWFTVLRLYGPIGTWFDRTWRPGEIDEVK